MIVYYHTSVVFKWKFIVQFQTLGGQKSIKQLLKNVISNTKSARREIY